MTATLKARLTAAQSKQAHLAETLIPEVVLSYYLVCKQHNCLMLERCHGCKHLIEQNRYFRKRINRTVFDLFKLCPHCSADFSQGPELRLEPLLISKLARANALLHQLVTTPFYRHPSAGTISSQKLLETFLFKPRHKLAANKAST